MSDDRRVMMANVVPPRHLSSLFSNSHSFCESRQLIENHKRRSVDGLAWPFLANWLAGQ